MKYLFFGLGALFLSAAFCSGTAIYFSGYTGEDVTSSEDTQFKITQTNICNSDTSGGTCSPLEDTLSLPSNSFILTTASVTADGYGTLALSALPSPLAGDASWIGPQANQDTGTTGGPINGGTCCKGTTTYTVTFNLTDFNLSDAVTLELILEGDDTVSSVTLNTHAVTLSTSPAYSSPTKETIVTVTADSLTATGDTLSIVVNNSGGGPTGLDAAFQFAGTEDPVPEPLTFALTGLGLAGLGALRLRRRS